MTAPVTTPTTDSAQPQPLRFAWTLLIAGILGLVAVGCGGSEATGPEEPTYSFIIPAGSADRIEQGETLDILPVSYTHLRAHET